MNKNSSLLKNLWLELKYSVNNNGFMSSAGSHFQWIMATLRISDDTIPSKLQGSYGSLLEIIINVNNEKTPEVHKAPFLCLIETF